MAQGAHKDIVKKASRDDGAKVRRRVTENEGEFCLLHFWASYWTPYFFLSPKVLCNNGTY